MAAWSYNYRKITIVRSSSSSTWLDIFSTFQTEIVIRCGPSLDLDTPRLWHDCTPATFPVVRSTHDSLVALMMISPLGTNRNKQYIHFEPLQSRGCSLCHPRPDETQRHAQHCGYQSPNTVGSGWSDKHEPIVCYGVRYGIVRWLLCLRDKIPALFGHGF